MIISRTPYRVSLFGGGTDLPAYFKKNGGSVIGFAVDQYSYIFLKRAKKMLNHNFRIVYSKQELCQKVDKIVHPSVKQTLKYYKFKENLELLHSGDLPAMSGMGSSSSFTVGLCNIIKNIKKQEFDRYDLAHDAITIEQKKIKESVGSQDQTFAAFGGFNKINFLKNGNINVLSINLSKKNLDLLKNSSFLAFTGKVRIAAKIEKEKIKVIKSNKSKQNNLSILNSYVNECEKILSNKKINISQLGELLHESWMIKKNISKNITNSHLDNIYNHALKHGAYGGKLLGAGGGGFFFFICDPKKKKNIIKKLNLKAIDIGVDTEGSKIIFNQEF